MRYSDVLSFVALVATLVFGLNFFIYRRDALRWQSQVDSTRKATHLQVKNLESKVDSLKSNESVFAKSIIYLDSCQSVKTTKADRAEKRGRFLGGLIKGLFPAL